MVRLEEPDYKSNTIMTATQIRAFIEAKGKGATFTDKLKDISDRTGIGVRSLWRYVEEGLPANPRAIVAKALKNLK